jgi:hypothetical protein
MASSLHVGRQAASGKKIRGTMICRSPVYFASTCQTLVQQGRDSRSGIMEWSRKFFRDFGQKSLAKWKTDVPTTGQNGRHKKREPRERLLSQQGGVNKLEMIQFGRWPWERPTLCKIVAKG